MRRATERGYNLFMMKDLRIKREIRLKQIQADVRHLLKARLYTGLSPRRARANTNERLDKHFQLLKILEIRGVKTALAALYDQCGRNGAIPQRIDAGYPAVHVGIGEQAYFRRQAVVLQKGNESFVLLTFEIEADENHFQSERRIPAVKFFENGEFFHAGAAPGSPKVDHQSRIAGLSYAGFKLSDTVVHDNVLCSAPGRHATIQQQRKQE